VVSWCGWYGTFSNNKDNKKMHKLKHSCENCDTEFTIEYDIDNSETDPLYCPFCSDYMLDTEDEIEEE
jgi:hypothetical protein